MIRLPFLALGFVLVSLPAFAQGVNFGTYTCRQQVPCSEDGSLTREQWAALGSQCVQTGFGSRTENLFDLTGIDSSGCLSTNQDAIPKGQNARLVPHCCVVQVQPQTCVFQCKLIQE